MHKVHGRSFGIAAIAINQHGDERIKAIHQQGDANPLLSSMITALKKGDDDQTPWTPPSTWPWGGVKPWTTQRETNETRWAHCETMAKGVRALFTDLGFDSSPMTANEATQDGHPVSRGN